MAEAAAAVVSSTAPKLFEAKRREGGGGGDNNAWEKRTCTRLLHRHRVMINFKVA